MENVSTDIKYDPTMLLTSELFLILVRSSSVIVRLEPASVTRSTKELFALVKFELNPL